MGTGGTIRANLNSGGGFALTLWPAIVLLLETERGSDHVILSILDHVVSHPPPEFSSSTVKRECLLVGLARPEEFCTPFDDERPACFA